jgi:hypothetical protein
MIKYKIGRVLGKRNNIIWIRLAIILNPELWQKYIQMDIQIYRFYIAFYSYITLINNIQLYITR